MASSDEEILIDKMGTKICQLTRVVYLLNNKYLDAQSNIEAIRETYDKELESLVRQANDYAKALKNKIDELEDEEDLEEKFNEFKEEIAQKYEKEKKESEEKYSKEIEIIKKNNSSKLDEYKSMYDESVKLLKEEIEKLKISYESKFNEIKNNSKKNIKNLNDEKEKLNKRIFR